MLKSFIRFHPNVPILISENSTNNETASILEKAKIPFIKNSGCPHGASIDPLFSSIRTKYCLLVDTDVIFLKPHTEILQTFKEMDLALMGEIVGDRGGKKLFKRVNPWHCFIDLEKIKQNKISFFDKKRMEIKGERIYDVGSSFFEDIKKSNLKIGSFNGNNFYYKHYEGMSWRVIKFNKNLNQDENIDLLPDANHCNENLMKYGLMINEIYKNETQHFNQIDLKYGC
jgi:hypothetical protein